MDDLALPIWLFVNAVVPALFLVGPTAGVWMWHCADKTFNERHRIAMWIVSQRPQRIEDLMWRFQAVAALQMTPFKTHWIRRMFVRDVRPLYPATLQGAFDDRSGEPRPAPDDVIVEDNFSFSFSPPSNNNSNDGSPTRIH